ncbi:MAG: hypothetical protein JW996_01085 [Candidatus Cloacimonetes bacterium]|nr:hypothetical protein [Candidatus Cloacimonadota bacterium]
MILYKLFAGKYRYFFYPFLLTITILMIFFRIGFLHYESPKISEADKYSSSELSGAMIWNASINSGVPWLLDTEVFDSQLLTSLRNSIEKVINWQILILVLGSLGIYVLLSFFRLFPPICFLAALLYSLTNYIPVLLGLQAENILISLAVFPWLILFVHYLYERKSLLAFGLLTFFQILLIRQLYLPAIHAYLIFTAVYIILRWLLNWNNIFGFILLFFGTVVLALISQTQPLLYLLDFYKFAQTSIFTLSLSGIMLIYLQIAIPVIFSLLVATLFSLNYNHKKKAAQITRNLIFFLLLLLILYIAFNSFVFELEIHRKYLQPFILLMLFLLISLAYLSKRIIKPLFLILLFPVLLVNFLFSQNQFFRNLQKPEKNLASSAITLSDEYLLKDEEIFRIFPLGPEMKNNRWALLHQTIGGNYQICLKRYSEIIDHCLYAELINRVPINWNILNMLNVKYLIYNEKLSLDNLEYAYYDLIEKQTIYLNKNYLPRAWFASDTLIIHNPYQIRKKLNSPSFDPSKTAILETKLEHVASPVNSRITLTDLKNEFLSFEVETDTTSLLVISEIYYPARYGWNAYLDGDEIPIYPVNYILRGVIIPSGIHQLEMKFELENFSLTWYISLSGFILTLLLLITGAYLYRVKNYRGEIVYRLKR